MIDGRLKNMPIPVPALFRPTPANTVQGRAPGNATMKKSLALALAVLFALAAPALAAKIDVSESIPIFQGLLANYNQELGRLDDLVQKLENSGSDCQAARNAALIVESYKKSMLLAGDLQDVLVSYSFIDKGLADMNLYLWTRINHMRLQAFSYVTDAEKALERLSDGKNADVLPILGDAAENIRQVYGKIRDVEDAFAQELGKKGDGQG